MLKKLKIVVKTAGHIPFINARGPINTPIWVKEVVYDRLKRIGIEVKVVDEKTVESVRERLEKESTQEVQEEVVEPEPEPVEEEPIQEEEPVVESEEEVTEEPVEESTEETVEEPEVEEITAESVEEFPKDEENVEEVEITIYSEEEIEELTNAEKRDVLDKRGVDYKYNAVSDDLEELVLESQLEYME